MLAVALYPYLTLRCERKRASKGPPGLIRMPWVYILKCTDGSYYSSPTCGERQIKGRLRAKKEALIKGDLKIDSGSFQMARKGQRAHPKEPFEARFARTSG
jgi:hypothetical protein